LDKKKNEPKDDVWYAIQTNFFLSTYSHVTLEEKALAIS